MIRNKKKQNTVKGILPNSTFDIIPWWGEWSIKHTQKLVSVICAITLAFISQQHNLIMTIQHNSKWMAVDLNIWFLAVTRDSLHPGDLTSDIKCKDCEPGCSSAANAQIKNVWTCNYTFTYVCMVSSWKITQHIFMYSYNTAWRKQTLKLSLIYLLPNL